MYVLVLAAAFTMPPVPAFDVGDKILVSADLLGGPERTGYVIKIHYGSELHWYDVLLWDNWSIIVYSEYAIEHFRQLPPAPPVWIPPPCPGDPFPE